MEIRTMSERKLVHVVDDEDAIRRSLAFLLRTAGYKVARWDNGEAFLMGADKAVPACAVLDIRMPGLDGLQVQARMRSEGFNFPVIIITGHGEIDLATRAMKAGALDFIEKPFERGALIAAVETAFRHLADRSARIDAMQWAQTELGKLTPREQEVLDGLACGLANKSIGFDLGISSRTVEVYRANIMTKLAVPTFADALRIAFAAGLGSDELWRQRSARQQKELPGLVTSETIADGVAQRDSLNDRRD
jgi:two-component system response regulator FixJ